MSTPICCRLFPGLETFRGLHCRRIWQLQTFPYGDIKTERFSHKLQDTEKLKARIRNVPKDIVCGVTDSFRNRLEQCTANRAAQLDIIFIVYLMV